jgi:hypothetical protein
MPRYVSIEENIEILLDIEGKAQSPEAYAAVADAMAAHIVERIRKITLRQSRHPSGSWHRARPNEPPATASGFLAKSTFYTPAHKSIRARAVVENSAEYSRILEFGCVIESFTKRLHWMDSGGNWYHEILFSPPHPFMEPTVTEAMADGSLRDAATEAFRPYDP